MMQIALYLLRKFWKPLAILLVVGLIFNAGYRRAKAACDAANLRAEIVELKRQSMAATKVLAQAAKDSNARVAEIETLTMEVEAYEISVSESAGCSLSADDARRLQRIK